MIFEESVNLKHNNVFIHPEFLPNTNFIKKRPESVKKNFNKIIEDFRETHSISKSDISRKFFFTGRVYEDIMSDDYNMTIKVMQQALNRIKEYENNLVDSSRKKRYNIDIRENFLKKIESWNKRHFISEGQSSKFFFGSRKVLCYLRLDKVTIKCSTLDKVLLSMYKIDQELIKEMGEVYVEWEQRRKVL